MGYKILVVDDEESIRITFDDFLRAEGYDVVTAKNLDEARHFLNDDIDMVFLDILLGNEDGMSILRDAKKQGLLCPVVMITGAPSIDTATEAVRYGAYDYILKPVLQQALLRVSAHALEHSRILKEKELFRIRLEGLFRCVKEGIVIVDKDLHIVEVNESAQTIFGFDDSIIGKHLDELNEDKRFVGLLKFYEIIKARFEGEIYRINRNTSEGDNQALSLTASPLITEDGANYGYIMIVRDETVLAETG